MLSLCKRIYFFKLNTFLKSCIQTEATSCTHNQKLCLYINIHRQPRTDSGVPQNNHISIYLFIGTKCVPPILRYRVRNTSSSVKLDISADLTFSFPQRFIFKPCESTPLPKHKQYNPLFAEDF